MHHMNNAKIIESSNIKRSLFGVVSSMLDSANMQDTPNNDILLCYRKILERLYEMRNNRVRFMGVNTADLGTLITDIFMKDHKILPESEFGAFGYNDMQRYIEICRRISIASMGYRPNEHNNDVAVNKTSNAKVQGKAKSQFKLIEPKWSFESKNGFAILKALNEGNVDCAKFVIENKRDRKNSKNLIKKAQDILSKQMKVSEIYAK